MHWELDIDLLLVGSVAMFLAALVRRVTGFGFAMISVGLLSIFVHPVEAVATTLLLVMVLSARSISLMRGSADRRLALEIAVFGVLGVPVGVAVARYFDENLLRAGIGLVILTSLIPMMLRPPSISASRREFVAIAGSAAGFLNAVAAIPAPPLLIYLMARKDVSLEIRRATLIAIFTALSLIALAGHFAGGTIHLATVQRAFLFVPATLLGDAAGRRIKWGQSRLAVDRLSMGIVGVSSSILFVAALAR